MYHWHPIADGVWLSIHCIHTHTHTHTHTNAYISKTNFESLQALRQLETC